MSKSMKVEVLEDGTLHYISDGHIVMTGPVDGYLTLDDGTAYHVGPDFVEVDSTDHAEELAHKIGLRHDDAGHPAHLRDSSAEPFTYTAPEGK